MTLGNCGKTCRCFFIFFNAVFSMIGLVILGLGIFIKIHPSPAQFLHFTGNDQYIENNGLILIVFGVLVLLVPLCGCVGAYNSSKCLLGMYITFSTIILLGALVIFISTIVFIFRFWDIWGKTAPVIETFHAKYKVKDTSFIKTWNYVQSQFKCCGANNFTDYHVIFIGKDQGKVPISCCMSSYNVSEAASIVSCPEYEVGCALKVQIFMRRNDHWILDAEICIIVLAIIGISIAAWLCRRGDEKENYSTL